jgi:serine peptidase DegS
MSKINKLMGFILRAVITGLALAFVVVYLWPAALQKNHQAQEAPPQHMAPAPASYAEAVNRAAPAVVSIYTKTYLPSQVPQGGQSASGFRLYQLRAIRDLGSGVILNENGYILTNLHVIQNVTEIEVAFWDGRIIPAEVVGTDPETDLAVLKVNLEGLPVAPVNENSAVLVGDVVLAIGNSFGLSHTVTMGIVSATGRNDLRSVLYEDFIQTDAAINAGNSGGALINASGDLIGINTLKSTMKLRDQVAQNIGFAIPITLARDVMDQIIEYGTVRRGWLGANFADLRRTLLPDGSAVQNGVSISGVQQGGPAWNAGIRQGDLITTMDGEPVTDASRFLLAISQREPGSQVELEVVRRGQSFQTYATLIQQPPLKLD